MLDFDQCACSGINLDKLIQPMILLFLSEQELHGYGLVQHITDSPMLKGEKPDPTGVYRFLKSMEERRLVVSSWEFGESGSPRKMYRITPDGLTCLKKWVGTLREYVTSIESLLTSADGVLDGLPA